jgi:putative Holliday junction resolvase
MTVVAMDVGDRRVGLAISDPSGTLATPYGVAHYARALAGMLSVPVELVDERYSTVTADALLVEAGRQCRVPIDAAAAAVILQDYLDTHSGSPLR